MPPAELQRLFGLAVEPAGKQISLLSRRHEQPHSMPNYCDDRESLQPTCWDSMWIDMGGEG